MQTISVGFMRLKFYNLIFLHLYPPKKCAQGLFLSPWALI